MPSSTLRHLGNQPGQPVMQPAFVPSYRASEPLIGPWSFQAAGVEAAGLAQYATTSQTYPAASRVLAFMFVLADYYLVQKVWWVNGTTATTDSADVGVYNEAGTVLLVSGGSTAIATANVVQEIDCTDTLLKPGRYWCAYVQGGVTATPICANGIAVGTMRCLGFAQMAGSGSTLGATFTPAALVSNIFPMFGIASRTQVA